MRFQNFDLTIIELIKLLYFRNQVNQNIPT